MNWIGIYLLAGALTFGQALYKHTCGAANDPFERPVLIMVTWPIMLPTLVQRECKVPGRNI